MMDWYGAATFGGTRPVAGPYLVRDGVRREFRIASAAAAAEVEGNMS